MKKSTRKEAKLKIERKEKDEKKKIEVEEKDQALKTA